jgi:hypothetical protein
MQENTLAIRTISLNTLSEIDQSIIPADVDNLIVMPFIDQLAADRSANQLATRAGCSGLLLKVEDKDRQGFISVINQIYRTSKSQTFGYVAQDAFSGRNWLHHAVSTLDSTKKGLLAFNDGKWMGAMAAFGLVRKEWADNNYGGDLFHTGYQRHYADVELSILAINEKQYCYNSNSVLIEVDWEKENSSVCPEDKILYRSRIAKQIDGRITNAKLLNLFS